MKLTILFMSSVLGAANLNSRPRDHRLSLHDWQESFGFRPSLIKSRLRSPKISSRSSGLPLAPSPPKAANQKFDDFEELSSPGESCSIPNALSHGYAGTRRRGFTKVTEGVFCDRGTNEGSKCFLMCEKGSRLVTSSRKRFKCKCKDGDCKWTINTEESMCEEHFCTNGSIMNGFLVSTEDESVPCTRVKPGQKCMPKCKPGFKLYKGSRPLTEPSPSKCYCPRRGQCGFRRTPVCLREDMEV